MSAMARPPLEGVRIIDLTTFLSGPSASQLLGDLGAEVIKVEALVGDSSRAIAGPEIDGVSSYYLANNRNKRSITVDLKHPRGKEILLGLIANCDVVLENFRPGVTDRLGIPPTELSKKYPSLIWASISGFGQTGPMSQRPAYDMVVQALSGVMSLTGHPGSPAARLGIPAGDVVAGLYAVIGILAALRDRDRLGRGRVIDVSMLQGQLAMLSYQALYTMVNDEAPGPQGARHDSIATYRSFRGGDGREFVVTANTPGMWENLCEVLEVPELVDDPRFIDAAGRLRNKEALWEILEARFDERPAAEWVELLAQASVPVAPVKNVLEAIEDAREANDGSLITVSDDRNSFENVATPIKFLDTETVVPAYPPALGADTVDILTELLGYTDDAIDELVSAGIVSVPSSDAPLVKSAATF